MGKYYVWEDIRSKNIMKEFHFIKALGKGTILKVGKIKVARKVDINTDSTKKLNPRRKRPNDTWPPGAGCGIRTAALQPGAREVIREEAVLSMTKNGPSSFARGSMQAHTWWPFDGLDQQFEWDLLPKIYQPDSGCDKLRVTNTAQGTKRTSASLVPLFVYFSSYLPCSTALGCHSMVKANFQIHRFLAWRSMDPQRFVNELQQPWDLKLYTNLCV